MNAPRIEMDGSARVQELIQALLPAKDVGSLAGGRILPGSGETVELTDPATGQVFLTYADAGPAVIEYSPNPAG